MPFLLPNQCQSTEGVLKKHIQCGLTSIINSNEEVNEHFDKHILWDAHLTVFVSYYNDGTLH